MLNALVPVMMIQIDTCGKGVSSLRVKMILGSIVIAVTYIAQAFFQVGNDMVIDLFHREASVILLQLGFRLSNIRYAYLFCTYTFVLVSLTKDVGQNKVIICTKQQSLSIRSTELCRQFGVFAPVNDPLL